MRPVDEKSVLSGWRARLHEIIYETDTCGPALRRLLIAAIVASVIIVMLDSVAWINESYGSAIYAAEWFFTGLFTVEYVLRLVCVARAHKVRDELLRRHRPSGHNAVLPRPSACPAADTSSS